MSLSHKQAMATPIKAIHINGNGDSARRPTPEAGLFQTPTNTRPFKPTALFGDGTPSRMFPGDVRVESLGLSGGSNDPFVSSGMKNRKLSPTADNFKPFAISMNMSATTNSEGGVLLGSPEFGNGQQELGTANVPSFSSSYEPSTTPPITQSGTFTTDGHSSRVLRVIGLWEEVTNEELDASLKVSTPHHCLSCFLHIFVTFLSICSIFYLQCLSRNPIYHFAMTTQMWNFFPC